MVASRGLQDGDFDAQRRAYARGCELFFDPNLACFTVDAREQHAGLVDRTCSLKSFAVCSASTPSGFPSPPRSRRGEAASAAAEATAAEDRLLAAPSRRRRVGPAAAVATETTVSGDTNLLFAQFYARGGDGSRRRPPPPPPFQRLARAALLRRSPIRSAWGATS